MANSYNQDHPSLSGVSAPNTPRPPSDGSSRSSTPVSLFATPATSLGSDDDDVAAVNQPIQVQPTAAQVSLIAATLTHLTHNGRLLHWSEADESERRNGARWGIVLPQTPQT
jgi:hypothetical protein